MAAYMKNPTALVKQIHTVQHFLAEYIQPPTQKKGQGVPYRFLYNVLFP